MKNLLLILLMMHCQCFIKAQMPVLNIHFVSHNEPNDQLQSPLNYTIAKNNLLQMAHIVDSNNVKWNLQTSDGLVFGARSDEANTTTNIFKTLAQPPFNDNIEIDPRSKNMPGRNIADQWYLLDSLGANPSTHLGGCIYTTTNAAVQPIDWEQYRQPIIGNIHGNSWQCTIITGAGSYPPHDADLNDFGVFKPDTATNFYHHNPAKNLWCMGTGCAPVLTDSSNEQEIIDLIQGQVDSIQNGLWPQNKFYLTRIMTNQRDFNPIFFHKLRIIIDSLKTMPITHLQWSTISEAFNSFQTWQTSTGLNYSQWLCGETINAYSEILPSNHFEIAPNPTNNYLVFKCYDTMKHNVCVYDFCGNMVFNSPLNNGDVINLTPIYSGLFVVTIDAKYSIKLIKE